MFDILGGFNAAARQEREAVRQEQAKRDAREMSILETLARSPDPEIAQMAIAGMLNFADPRKKKKGLAGFIGETEGHPALGEIGKLIGTPQLGMTATSGAADLVSGGTQLPTPPASTGSAAQPTTTPIQGGPMASPQLAPGSTIPVSASPELPKVVSQPMAPPSGMAAAAGGGAGGPGGATPPPGPPAIPVTPGLPPSGPPNGAGPTVQRRRVLSSGPYEDRVRGVVEGAQAYGAQFTPEEVKQIALEFAGYNAGGAGGAASFQAVDVELPDGTQRKAIFDRRQGLYLDPDTRQALPGAKPRTSTGSTSLGADRETGARLLFGKRASELTQPEMAKVDAWALERTQDAAFNRAAGANDARAVRQLDPQELFQATTRLSDQWQKESAAAKYMLEQQRKIDLAMEAAAAGDNSAAHETLIVTFEKILDEDSVVREAEYLRPGQNLGLLQRVQGTLQRLRSGGSNIPNSELRQYADMAKGITDGVVAGSKGKRDRIYSMATAWGVNPYHVLGADLPEGIAPPSGTPLAPGAPALFAGDTPTGPRGGAPTPRPAPQGGPPAPGGQMAAPQPSAAPAPATPPPAPARSAPKVGDHVTWQGKPTKIVAIHPTTGKLWLESMGPVPASWGAR